MNGNIVCYPLTHPQKGIWYIENLYPGKGISNISATLRLKGTVDYSRLEKAINVFIEKNGGMRIRTTIVDHEPMQYFSGYSYMKLDFFDFSDTGTEGLYKWDEKNTNEPFKIHDSDLFYFALIKVNENDGGFYIKMHHLICDAWTMILLVNSIFEYYTALGSADTISEGDKPSYLDFILREEEYKKSPRFENDKEYWDEKLRGWTELTTLKPQKNNILSTKAKRRTFVIPKKLAGKIKEFCSQKGFSEYVLFLSALSMYINRVTFKEDMVVGTTLLNRANAREKNTVGMFASSAVPIRINTNGNMSFGSFAEYISREVLSLLRHQRYPYDLILKQVRETTRSANALFDIVITFQNAKLNKKSTNVEYDSRWHFNGHQIESLIININNREEGDRLIVDYDYLVDAFYPTEIDFIHQHIVNLLWHALDNPEKSISRLEMLSEQEKHKILHQFNATAADYRKDVTIHRLFEEQVERTPENIALVVGEKEYTYRQLNIRANQLAATLRKAGVKQNDIVGLVLDRSFDMLTAILAVMKAGGAYLPIEPDHPVERINFMLADSSSRFLLTQSRHAGRVRFDGEVILLDMEKSYDSRCENLENINVPGDLIYIIYTSGSTGQPKGVMIEHGNVVRLLFNSKFQFDFNEKDVWTLFHSYGFDFSVWEMYGALLYGGKLVVIPKSTARDTHEFSKELIKHEVTVLNQTPAAFYNLMAEEAMTEERSLRLRYVVFGGEALKPTMLKEFKSRYPETKLINMYGITETTVHVTFKELSDEDIVSVRSNIGKPIPTLTTYIMDKNLTLLPIGVPGEICVGGAGVARGYLNRPELTGEKFPVNPYNPSERLYRSGDLGSWYAKGDMEYLGRIDNQVKIRGFRIETGEIERKLLSHSNIKDAVVVAKKDKFDKSYLCAYLVCDKAMTDSEFKMYLSRTLPDYMIPGFFIRVDKLPLTANGKVDMKQLPEPDGNINPETEYVPPATEVEKKMGKVWSDLLGISRIGIDDNFFSLGGDSLTVIQVLTRVFKYNWGLTASDFYLYPTIRELAGIISGKDIKIAAASGIDIIDIRTLEETACTRESRRTPGNFLLTGSTGFLGIHILNDLMTNTDANVYCLVRGRNSFEARRKLSEMLDFYFNGKLDGLLDKRIFAVNGDITAGSFGLSKESYEKLGNTIDAVIHSAANVKYYGDYSGHEKINVEGTGEVIEFCGRYGIILHHVSTIGISGSYLVDCNENGLELTERDFYIGQNFTENVYVRSKFEAENLVFKAIKKGLDAYVYRMGNLTARYADGHFQHNIADNAFCNILKTILEINAVPDGLLDTDVEFTPVDLASRALVLIANDISRTAALRTFHITNHKLLKMSHLLEFMKSMYFDISVLGSAGFAKFVENISQDEQRQGLLYGIISDISKTKELGYNMPVKVSSELTRNFLEDLGFQWPEIDGGYLKKLIGYLQEAGYLNKAEDMLYR